MTSQTSSALAKIASDVLQVAQPAVTDASKTNSLGNATLDIFECIAMHIMENIQSIDNEPLVYLNEVCGNIAPIMKAELQQRHGNVFSDVARDVNAEEIEDTRLAALQAMGLLAHQGDFHEVAIVSSGLGHAQPPVRQTAREIFCHVVANEEARSVRAEKRASEAELNPVATLIERLDTDNLAMLQSTLESAPKFIPRGDQRVIPKLESCLANGDVGVRCEAIKALCQIAEKDDSKTIQFALNMLSDEDNYIRLAAVESLGCIVEKPSAELITRLAEGLQDEDRYVFRASSKLLNTVANRGNKDAVAALMPMLDHEEPRVRRAAVKGLGQFADGKDQAVLQCLTACTQDEDEDVKDAAVQALNDILASLQKILQTSSN